MRISRVTDNDKIIGQTIRITRRNLGFSQGYLAQHLNVSFQQIQKYENGTNRISASRLLDVANFLNTPISVFYERIESDSYELTLLKQQHLKMLKAFNNLDDKTQKCVLNLAVSLGKTG